MWSNMFRIPVLVAGVLLTVVSASPTPTETDNPDSMPSMPPMPHDTMPGNTTLTNWGMLLFPGMQAQDITGPLDPLIMLAFDYHMNLYTIGATAGPITTKSLIPGMNPQNSSYHLTFTATYSVENAPPLDVLIVPGGAGAFDTEQTSPLETFIRERFPELQYLISVCTGANIAARAGVLDGRRATTNKQSWMQIAPNFPRVKWVAPARWTVDGKVWASSGVNSAVDLIFSFIEEKISRKHVEQITGIVEYERHADPCWDPFAEKFGIKTDEPCRILDEGRGEHEMNGVVEM